MSTPNCLDETTIYASVRRLTVSFICPKHYSCLHLKKEITDLHHPLYVRFITIVTIKLQYDFYDIYCTDILYVLITQNRTATI